MTRVATPLANKAPSYYFLHLLRYIEQTRVLSPWHTFCWFFANSLLVFALRSGNTGVSIWNQCYIFLDQNGELDKKLQGLFNDSATHIYILFHEHFQFGFTRLNKSENKLNAYKCKIIVLSNHARCKNITACFLFSLMW